MTQGLAAIPYGVFVVALCLRLPAGDFAGSVISILKDLPILMFLLWIAREHRTSLPPPVIA